MKTNTNTKLRSSVMNLGKKFSIVSNANLPNKTNDSHVEDFKNELLALIDQYVHQKQVEAKTDELLLAGKNYDGPRFAEYIDSRIASLNTEGEEQ